MTAQETPTQTRTIVLHVGGLHWATSARGIEHTLTTRPGVLGVEANALSQTATVTFDPTRTSLDDPAQAFAAARSHPSRADPPADADRWQNLRQVTAVLRRAEMDTES